MIGGSVEMGNNVYKNMKFVKHVVLVTETMVFIVAMRLIAMMDLMNGRKHVKVIRQPSGPGTARKSLKIPKWLSESAYRKITDNTKAKRKGTKG